MTHYSNINNAFTSSIVIFNYFPILKKNRKKKQYLASLIPTDKIVRKTKKFKRYSHKIFTKPLKQKKT